MRYLALVLPLIMTLFAGCGGGLEKFPTAKTTGKVMCNGAPVPYALVFFEPLKTGDSAEAGKQGVAITNDNGEFSISTYGEEDGAVVGKHRVRVGAPERSGWKCDCRTDSEFDLMQVDITDDGENNFELVLPKKKRGAEAGVDPDEDEDED